MNELVILLASSGWFRARIFRRDDSDLFHINVYYQTYMCGILMHVSHRL
jgi:hypothetical protein